MRRSVLARFPADLIDQAVSFEGLDNNEKCWPSGMIETVIGWMEQNCIAILEGRVFLAYKGEHFIAGLSWEVERDGQDWGAFVQRSAKVSLAFIKRNQIQGEENFYALKFMDEEEMLIRTGLPSNVPERFIDSAYPLTSIDWTEIAWKYEDIIQMIAFYADNRFILLGGDVYKMDHSNISPTYDNWYYNLQKQQYVDDISISKDQAIAYIENYYKRNGDTYYYTLTVSPLK